MPLTLLLDLDDTLLDTNIARFIPAYFQALADHLRRWVPPETMLSALRAGTEKMLANVDPGLTLREVFDREFYTKIGIAKPELENSIEEFYDNVFPSLRNITKERVGARELLDWAMGQGFRVAIATDPLFPRKATFERIRWAGWDPASLELVSSYETFHFTKSHPAYYAEVLGRLGWPDGPILMVGNDRERDLARAQQSGLRTYEVEAAPVAVAVDDEPGKAGTHAAGRGSLVDLRRWLEVGDMDSLEPSFKNQDAILAILTSTPAVLQSLVSGLSQAEWKREPSPEDWAMIEIIAHLRDTEREVHHAQLFTLISESQPFVPRPDAAVWAKQRRYLDDDGQQAIADFTAARKQTLRDLREVGPEVWNRPARHAIFGPTNFMEVVGFMADHDRLHIQQALQRLRGAP